MNKLIINTDGASRGNPGEAAVGIIIADDKGNILDKAGITLGIATNNEAEYMAVKLALERVYKNYKDILPVEVEIKADSLLIVKQLSGEYKIKNSRLKTLFDKVKCLEMEFGRVYYTHIPRSQNSLADEQANIALDMTH